MTISETVTITGKGADNTIIDAQTTSGIFDITNTAGDVNLNGLTLRNGRRLGGNNSSFNGGAVRSLATGTLAINQSILSGNRADYSIVGCDQQRAGTPNLGQSVPDRKNGIVYLLRSPR